MATKVLTFGLLFVVLAAIVSAAPCNDNGALKVAVYGATANTARDLEDVATKLTCSNFKMFSSVATFDVTASTPTLEELNEYDAVFIFSSVCLADAATFGDNIADYMDLGGGVVVAGSAFASDCKGLGGRAASFKKPCGGICSDIWDKRYVSFDTVFPDKDGSIILSDLPNLKLQKVKPKHPIVAGVCSFRGGSASLHHAIGTEGCCGGCVGPCRPCRGDDDIIGFWSLPDGTTKQKLVSEMRHDNTIGTSVSLNFFPPSSDVDPTYWDSNTDGARLMANSLKYVARPKFCPDNNKKNIMLIANTNYHALIDAADIIAKAKKNFPQISCVTFFDAGRDDTPTQEQFNLYGTIVVDAITYAAGDEVADRLSAYVAAGGGVVISYRACQRVGASFAAQCPFEVIFPETVTYTAGRPSLVVNDASSPILNGVSSFDGVAAYYYDITPKASSHLVASDTNGEPVVVTLGTQIVGLGFDMRSSDIARTVANCDDRKLNFWDATTDGGKIIANSIKAVFNKP